MPETRSSYPRLTPEAKVGLFVLTGIVLLVYMSLRVGGIKLGRSEGYILVVDFSSVAGLDTDASVRVAGVEVGRVKDIELTGSKARVELRIRPDVRIGRDFTAMLTTKGLLGERYIELVPGSPNAPPLEDGDTITNTTSYADMDRLITMLSDVSADIKSVTTSLRKVLGGAEGESTLKNIVGNIEEISYRVNSLITKNEEQFNRMLENLGEFTALLKDEGPGIAGQIRTVAENLNEALLKTSENLNSMIDENRGNLKEGVENLKTASLKLQEAMAAINNVTKELGPGISATVNSARSIAEKIDRGEGTLGKLINDPTMHENINRTVTGINRFLDKAESFHTFVGYRGEYLFDAKDTKSYFTLKVQPGSDRFYLIEVIDDPRGKRSTETIDVTTGSTTTTRKETTTSDSRKFSAQIAKRVRGFTFRGGIIESTGGVGIDYELFKDRLRFSLEAFDFDNSGNAHIKAGARLVLHRFFYLTAGYDDLANRSKKLDSVYAGIGFEFRDDDIKYLISSAPPISP